MFKFVSRHDLWNRAVWCLYFLLGGILYFTGNMNANTILAAQILLTGAMCAPGFCAPLRRYLDQPRNAVLQLTGRLFTA